jgi:hypothetical protein
LHSVADALAHLRDRHGVSRSADGLRWLARRGRVDAVRTKGGLFLFTEGALDELAGVLIAEEEQRAALRANRDRD